MLSFVDFMGIMRSFDFNLLGGESGESLRFYLSFVELFAESENFLKSFAGAEIETLSKNAKIDLSLANSFVESLRNHNFFIQDNNKIFIPALNKFFKKNRNDYHRKYMREYRQKNKNSNVSKQKKDTKVLTSVNNPEKDDYSEMPINTYDLINEVLTGVNKDFNDVLTSVNKNNDEMLTDVNRVLTSVNKNVNEVLTGVNSHEISVNTYILTDNTKTEAILDDKNSFSVNQTSGKINKVNKEDKTKINKLNKYKKEGEKNLEQIDEDEIRVITERLKSSHYFSDCYYEDSNEISILLKLFPIKTIFLTIDKLEEWNKLKEVKPKNFYKTMRFWCEENSKKGNTNQDLNPEKGNKKKSKIDEEHDARNEYGYGSIKVPDEFKREYAKKREEMKKKNEVPQQEVENVDNNEISNFINFVKGK